MSSPGKQKSNKFNLDRSRRPTITKQPRPSGNSPIAQHTIAPLPITQQPTSIMVSSTRGLIVPQLPKSKDWRKTDSNIDYSPRLKRDSTTINSRTGKIESRELIEKDSALSTREELEQLEIETSEENIFKKHSDGFIENITIESEDSKRASVSGNAKRQSKSSGPITAIHTMAKNFFPNLFHDSSENIDEIEPDIIKQQPKVKTGWFWEKIISNLPTDFNDFTGSLTSELGSEKPDTALKETIGDEASKLLPAFYPTDTDRIEENEVSRLPKRRLPSVDAGYNVLCDAHNIVIRGVREIPTELEWCDEVQVNGLDPPRIWSICDSSNNKVLMYALEYSTFKNVATGCGYHWSHWDFFRQPQQLVFFTIQGQTLMRLIPTINETCVVNRIFQECKCWGTGGKASRLIKRYNFITPDHKVIANLWSDAYFYCVPRYHLLLQRKAHAQVLLEQESDLLLTFIGTCLDCEDNLSYWGFKPPDNDEDVDFYDKDFKYACIRKYKKWATENENIICTVHFSSTTTMEIRAIVVAQAFLVHFYCWEPVLPKSWGYAGG